MKKRLTLVMVVQCLAFIFILSSFADSSIPKKKQTALGKYITAETAYAEYSKTPDTIHIMDVRTPCEYAFVGHATMAVNIPLYFQKPGLTDKNKPIMPANENFVARVEAKFKKTDMLFVMCRSGGRSAACINKLAKAGFTNIYNIIDGFEGDKDDKGYRTVNGWKNSGAPWTYKLDPALVYRP
ncbi:Rhodanese-related sulfurtransferase [Desulfocicer vacuolatum DSM 3385]|uniref:Rhodanese-related sulfurtransferase n=1 Tax=Desulfocicer vacuolatum DSM 3385 TaxID=1121400 RepID=A0A1W2DM78_9BACT|nr:rhodanese-like domain-containing protein [Desulfocicer vacuolatum]SMC98148.1 Rhodanese-related sulfurtransferase [Desulfocicer vacuolatum DSM 3385]